MVAIARLLVSALLGLLLLIRLDRVIMMKGFEFWDIGEFMSSCMNDTLVMVMPLGVYLPY